MVLERVFQERVIRELKKLPNCWFFKTFELSVRGIPDIIGLINGKFFALELKNEKGRATKLQIHILNKISKAGGYAIVCKPNNFKIILEELSNL